MSKPADRTLPMASSGTGATCHAHRLLRSRAHRGPRPRSLGPQSPSLRLARAALIVAAVWRRQRQGRMSPL